MQKNKMVPLPSRTSSNSINLNRKKKKKNHFNFSPSLSFSRRRRSLHPSFRANFFLKFHRNTFPHGSHFSASCLLLLRIPFSLLTLFVIIININFFSLSLSLCGLIDSMLLAEEFCCRRHTVRQSQAHLSTTVSLTAT